MEGRATHDVTKISRAGAVGLQVLLDRDGFNVIVTVMFPSCLLHAHGLMNPAIAVLYAGLF
jgi:hypothetical protein